MIAKWMLTEEELDKVHKKMESIIWEKWAYVDDIYYCPHHPDKWFKWEVPELKTECDCRKPKIWMIKKAIAQYNIDVNQSFIIWDSTRDIQTWKNSWLKTILVKTWYAWNDWKYDVKPDFVFDNLNQACSFIIKNF
jgi:HAD superfamily hydrolase (TIGR01662 family)